MATNLASVFRSARVLRDMARREAASKAEIQRRAYLFVARNTSLPANIRHKAQLGLNALTDTGPSIIKVKNRCVETGRGRGE